MGLKRIPGSKTMEQMRKDYNAEVTLDLEIAEELATIEEDEPEEELFKVKKDGRKE